jgi:glycosyltransferase involved in cell wall biosynthesis
VREEGDGCRDHEPEYAEWSQVASSNDGRTAIDDDSDACRLQWGKPGTVAWKDDLDLGTELVKMMRHVSKDDVGTVAIGGFRRHDHARSAGTAHLRAEHRLAAVHVSGSATAARRVAIFDAYPYLRGGTHVGAEEVARIGRETGRWNAVLVLPDEGAAAEWLRERGTEVRVTRLPASLMRFAKSWRRHLLSSLAGLPVGWWRLSRAFRDFDIVHSHDVRGLILAGPAALLARRRLVVHIYDSKLTGKAWRWFARGPLRWSRLPVVVPSRLSASICAGEWAAHLVELPNSVEVYGRAPEAPEPTVVTLARVHPNKGLEYLVDAAELLANRGVEAKLLIAGAAAPGFESLAEDLASRASRIGRVTFLGDVDDVHGLLAGAWVYAHPSVFDNLPLAMVEAAACGLPIVATRVGGCADIVEDGVNGYLVPARNPAAFADALETLLGSAETREKFGLAGVERINKRFSRDRYTTVLGELYCA